ncbi:hypothetical protein [Chitinivorax sp. B]|uniref:DUF6901 family protein n=1 Tax=Chitinivorax sp. B TaxID=2502235 RepID=UPI0010F70BC3|nr:hypothetical protein [Chitinivorax sp. B]
MNDVIYELQFADGRQLRYTVSEDMTPPSTAELPDWTRLGFHQCRNCPLQADSTPHCPVAVKLMLVTDTATRIVSYDEAEVTVTTPQRVYRKHTTAQHAMGSLMGLLMATSDCPHTRFLAPMARFHLPFASKDETVYRSASTYLLAQYFRQQKGETPDWALTGLKAHYHELQTVNAGIAARLREVSQLDAAMNALVILDILAKLMPYSIEDALVDTAPAFL